MHAILLSAALTLSAADAPVLRAGAYAQDITPPRFPISVNGNMQDARATSVHDRLHARCLVLDDGTTRIALVVCDSCMLPRDLLDEAKALARQATGIPVERILISATHAHSCPTSTGVFQSDPDPEYVKFLPQQIAKGVARANAQREPAKVGWGVGKDPTQLFNRRWKMKPGTIAADPFGRTTDLVKMNPGYQNPGLVEQAGPVDPDVSILSVQALDGRPIALLANYSLHYVGAPALSADYFGAFAERIKSLLGAESVSPPFVGIMSNGTSGDANNVNFAGPAPGRRQPFEQCRVVAESVARAALAAHKEIRHREGVTLGMAEQEVELGVRLPGAEDIAQARKTLAGLTPPYKTIQQIYARETLLLAEYPPAVKARIQAIRIGELGIASSPCETFAETGLEIKKQSPLKPTFTIELANGYNGYLPTPEQHRLGGYETWRARSSYLEVGAAPKVTSTILALLRQVAAPGTAGEDKGQALFRASPLTQPGEFTAGIEGPNCDKVGNVYAVNYRRQGTIGRVTPDGKAQVFVELPQGSIGNGIVFDRMGRMYVADYTGHNVLRIDPLTKAVSVFAHEPQMNQPNDLAIAPNGTLYASDPNWGKGTGQIWRIDPDGRAARVASDMGTTNGIEVSPDGKTLYVNESVQRNVWAFAIGRDGSLPHKRLVKKFDDHGFDGMRCDVDGNLYVTRYGKGTVVKLSPTGQVLQEVDVLGASPSNLCFGGPDGRTVYVTEVQHRRLVQFRVDRPGLAWQRARE